MPEHDPSHWLFRLNADEWLASADNELRLAQQAFLAKQQRPAVAHARRAAGMALNALLWGAPDDSYGRSYMDHLAAFSKDPAVPAELRAAAGRLIALPMTQQLVTLGPRGDAQQADPAEHILQYVRGIIAPKQRA